MNEVAFGHGVGYDINSVNDCFHNSVMYNVIYGVIYNAIYSVIRSYIFRILTWIEHNSFSLSSIFRNLLINNHRQVPQSCIFTVYWEIVTTISVKFYFTVYCHSNISESLFSLFTEKLSQQYPWKFYFAVYWGIVTKMSPTS